MALIRKVLLIFAAAVLMVAAGHAAECLGDAEIWYDFNSDADDQCIPYYHGTAVGVTWTGVGPWPNEGDFEETDAGDRIFEPDGAYETAGNRTFSIWLQTEQLDATIQIAFTKRNKDDGGDNKNNGMLYIAGGTDLLRCVVGTGIGQNTVDSTAAIKANKMYHAVCMMDVTNSNCSLWVNGTLNNTGACAATQVNTGALVIGCYGDNAAGICKAASPMYFDGKLDEFVYINRTLNATEINNLFLYNNITTGVMGGVPPGARGCNVSINAPPSNDHNNSASPVVNVTATCYQNMPTRCYLSMNNTQSGDNSTTVVNGTSFKIVTNSSKADGRYYINVTCLNATVSNTSATRQIWIDTVTPTLTWTAPANNSVFPSGGANNLDIVGNDSNIYNLTCSVENASGQVAIYSNSTPTGEELSLYNEYTNWLSPGLYNLSCNVSDEHSIYKWKPDKVEAGEGFLRVEKGSTVMFSWDWNQIPDYSLLSDRIKWGVNAPLDEHGNLKIKFVVECDRWLDIIEDSEFEGHMVCGLTWLDFQDIRDEYPDMDITVVREAWNKAEVELEQDLNRSESWEWIDPQAGGLNFRAGIANFTIDAPPTVVLVAPANNTYQMCWLEPCSATFQYIPADESGINQAWLYGNFSGAWAVNETVRMPVNGSVNSFTINLNHGTYTWNVEVKDTFGSNATAATNWTLHITKPALIACGVGNMTVALNFTFWDEENVTQNLTADMDATFWIWNSDRTLNLTYNNSWVNVPFADICIYPPNASFLVDSWQVYRNASYDPRAYFLDDAMVTTSAASNISLYLLDSTLGTQITITLQDEAGVGAGDALIFFERYYAGENLFRTVAMVRTSADSGEASTYLRPNDAWHRIMIIMDHSVVGVYPARQIPCDPAYTSCPLTLTATIGKTGEWFSYTSGYPNALAHPCEFNATSDTLACSWVDTTGLMKYSRLRMWHLGPFAPTEICDVNASTASGTLLCTIPPGVTGIFDYLFSAHFAQEVPIESGMIESGAATATFAALGILPVLFLFLTLVFAGSWNPVISMVLGFLALLASWVMGLLAVELAGIIAFGIVVGMLAYKMRA